MMTSGAAVAIAVLTLGVGLGVGCAATYQLTAHAETTACPDAPAPTGGIPPGFFQSVPLPLSGKQY